MKQVTISLGERGYTITIAPGLFAEYSLFQPLRKSEQVMVVTNETVAPLYLQQVINTLQQLNIQADTLILPDGEHYKTLASVDAIFSALLQKNYGRDCVLIALGGGVIGDITGFAAACYQRGVRFIQMPTTLLAQVDSSVGGKTGVNHPLGKNMIGAFYQPLSVIIDVNCLSSLPPTELRAGLAEVIKYGVILDRHFFTWLEQNIESLLALDATALAYCIHRCCELKAEVVAADEREQGLRMLLNLGHTFGHAIETEMGYGRWLHGEAVAVGMLMAAETARRLGQFSTEGYERLRAVLKRAKLPLAGPATMQPQDYLPHMMRDKKNRLGQLHLVLPLDLGKAEVVTGIDHDVIVAAIASVNRH